MVYRGSRAEHGVAAICEMSLECDDQVLACAARLARAIKKISLGVGGTSRRRKRRGFGRSAGTTPQGGTA